MGSNVSAAHRKDSRVRDPHERQPVDPNQRMFNVPTSVIALIGIMVAIHVLRQFAFPLEAVMAFAPGDAKRRFLARAACAHLCIFL